MSTFDADTRVREDAKGGYSAVLSRNWELWGPNGGYVAAIAMRAAGAAASVKRPCTFHGHYLRVARFEPVRLSVTKVHGGRRSESIRVSMFQDGEIVFEGILRTAATRDGLDYDEPNEFSISDPPSPRSLAVADESTIKHGSLFWQNFERRIIHPEYYREGYRTDSTRHEEWVHFAHDSSFADPFLDAARSLLLLDTYMWPAVYRRWGEIPFATPSLDITAVFHRPAAESKWLRVDTRAPVAVGGLIFGEGRVFDEQGHTLASGCSQQACVPRP